jgi:hypothetical protein
VTYELKLKKQLSIGHITQDSKLDSSYPIDAGLRMKKERQEDHRFASEYYDSLS